MRPLGRRRVGVFVAVAAALAIVSGGVAWSAIPGRDGRITACMLKSTGTIRLIDPAVKHCKTTEKQMQWNAASSVGGSKLVKWDGSGGVNYKTLRNGAETWLLTLPLPAALASGEVVATATVWITNWLDEPVWGGCTVHNQSGDAGGWPFTLPHGFNTISFQAQVSGTGRPLTLKCNLNEVGSLGNPAANGQVWAEQASLSAVPVATP
jgi:hypothetical protein